MRDGVSRCSLLRSHTRETTRICRNAVSSASNWFLADHSALPVHTDTNFLSQLFSTSYVSMGALRPFYFADVSVVFYVLLTLFCSKYSSDCSTMQFAMLLR